MNQIIQDEELNKQELKPDSPAVEETILKEENEEVLESTPEKDAEIIKPEEANTSNCLALTIQKEHKLVAVKNVFIHSLKVSWKVVVSAITLHILKLFF